VDRREELGNLRFRPKVRGGRRRYSYS